MSTYQHQNVCILYIKTLFSLSFFQFPFYIFSSFFSFFIFLLRTISLKNKGLTWNTKINHILCSIAVLLFLLMSNVCLCVRVKWPQFSCCVSRLTVCPYVLRLLISITPANQGHINQRWCQEAWGRESARPPLYPSLWL